jgi:2-methylisocitrate lyase-like PEP mutase family enzyme
MRKVLRRILAETPYTVMPGAFDPLSAKLIELCGFDVAYLSGGAFSRTNGYPDIGLLSLKEIVDGLARTVDALNIPLIADADTGYGNAINVIRTVREFERAGVAGLHLEDQIAPKKCGHYDGKAVLPVDEMVGKLKAALDTRRDPNLVIIARSDARAVEGLNAAIDRVNTYMEVGADLGFVEAPQSVEELEIVGRSINGPAVCNIFEGGKTPPVPAEKLAAMGFRLGIYPSQAHRAAIRAVREVLTELKKPGNTERVENRLATFAEREEIVDSKRWRAFENKYLHDLPTAAE